VFLNIGEGIRRYYLVTVKAVQNPRAPIGLDREQQYGDIAARHDEQDGCKLKEVGSLTSFNGVEADTY
jgi:hypothetical protein